MSENANEVSELISRLKDAEVLHYSVNQINEMISAAEERGRQRGMEESAKIADAGGWSGKRRFHGSDYQQGAMDISDVIATAIRAAKKEPSNV